MKKQIAAIISAALILTGLTACGNASDTRESAEQSPGTQNSTDNPPNGSGLDTSLIENLKGNDVSDGSSSELDYDYVTEHRFDKVIKTRGVYGETEIPDIHYENADSEGCVTHSPFGDEWQYIGLESMEFETHTFGDYTIRLVGHNVRTDKDFFPDRIFGSLELEVEKDGEVISTGGYSLDITGGAGAQYYPEQLLFPDKIGSYLDIYGLEYPVVAMNYYFGDNPERLVHKCVEFGVLSNGEFLQGFVGVCEPGCGVAYDFENCTSPETINAVNKEFSNCRAALFEAEKFKVADERTLVDEEADIAYKFDFTISQETGMLPFELYTAEKNAGSVCAANIEK